MRDRRSGGIDVTSLSERARDILRRNDRGGYTVPTAGLYPFQWAWDSCLVALGLATFDEARAWRELETLFAAQWTDGMVPHIVFHQPDPGYFPGPDAWRVDCVPPTSGITQPPVAATAVRKLLERARKMGPATAAARRLLPRLLAWHRWFHAVRDPHGEGLVAIVHPWESGMDNSPAWDAALARVPVGDLPPYQRRDTGHVNAGQRPTKDEYDRYMALVHGFRARGYDGPAVYAASPFRAADVGVNAILLRADRDLAWLLDRLGEAEPGAEVAGWIARGEDGFRTLWNPGTGRYCARDLVDGGFVTNATSAGFLAFYAQSVAPAVVDTLLAAFDRCMDGVTYGMPTVEADDPRFDGLRYWRGPVWVIHNYMIADGLRHYGETGRAARLVGNARALVETSGFWEYFDPIDGRGLGAADFSWTAAMWLAWLDRAASDHDAG